MRREPKILDRRDKFFARISFKFSWLGGEDNMGSMSSNVVSYILSGYFFSKSAKFVRKM